MDELTAFSRDVESIEKVAREPYEVPWLDLKLDFASRGGDEKRIARHIHQMCFFHVDFFRRSNFVRLAYVGRFFLTEAEVKNPIGIVSAARAILETQALLRHVQTELDVIATNSAQPWRERGAAFFEAIVRARFGTGDLAMRGVLAEHEVSEAVRRPYRTGDCITGVQKRQKEFAWIGEHYAFLCDWVHPNLASQSAGGAATRMGTEYRVGHVTFRLLKPQLIARQEYGTGLAADYLLDRTTERARSSLADGLEAFDGNSAQSVFY